MKGAVVAIIAVTFCLAPSVAALQAAPHETTSDGPDRAPVTASATVHNGSGTECSQCHRVSEPADVGGFDPCLDCHSGHDEVSPDDMVTQVNQTSLDWLHLTHVSRSNTAASNEDCTESCHSKEPLSCQSCHEPHSAATTECTDCHGSLANPGEHQRLRSRFVDGPHDWMSDCTVCHQQYNVSTFQLQSGSSIVPPSPTTSEGAVCLTCHSSLDESHGDGSDCASCHDPHVPGANTSGIGAAMAAPETPTNRFDFPDLTGVIRSPGGGIIFLVVLAGAVALAFEAVPEVREKQRTFYSTFAVRTPIGSAVDINVETDATEVVRIIEFLDEIGVELVASNFEARKGRFYAVVDTEGMEQELARAAATAERLAAIVPEEATHGSES